MADEQEDANAGNEDMISCSQGSVKRIVENMINICSKITAEIVKNEKRNQGNEHDQVTFDEIVFVLNEKEKED